jgi:OOP family OmpA-OmpF porin
MGDMDMLDTLHRRVGDDLAGSVNDSRVWARLFASDSITLAQDNVTSPSADARNWGFQVGADLYQNREPDGSKQNDAGFYVGKVRTDADVSGMTGATRNPAWVGSLNPEASVLAGYWTHKTGSGFYFDAVAQHSWYGGNGQAVTGTGVDIGGTGKLFSLEVGRGFDLAEKWQIEPQAQLVYHSSDLDDLAIPNATVSFGDNDSAVGRLGLRLVGDYRLSDDRPLKPYLRANWWHAFDSNYQTTFRTAAASTVINTDGSYNSGEIGAGFTLQLAESVIMYGELDHMFQLTGGANKELSKGVAASIGVRVAFGAKPVAAPPPPPAPRPPPPPPPAPPPQPVTVTLSADALFDFDSSTLRPAGRQSLDKLAEDLRGMTYEVLIVGGHTDRIGTDAYNQALSERRANSVRDYLVQSGIPANDVRATGYGEARPVTTLQQCQGQAGAALIACLQPDRRVEVEVSGTRRP